MKGLRKEALVRQVVSMSSDVVTPSPAAMAEPLGLSSAPHGLGRMSGLIEAALELVRRHARPAGVFADVTVDDFEVLYPGEGHNEPRSPLASIAPRADSLALFAVTLGGEVSRAIDALFSAHDFALGHALDAAASLATELAAGHLESVWAAGRGGTVVRYSPGYCGWHVSGQRALFRRLAPEEIGISLRESCLMEPLKSISGVLVAGPAGIHRFEPDFTFCPSCRARSCRRRMRDLADHPAHLLVVPDRRVARG